MLCGTASPEALARDAVKVERFDPESVNLPNTQVFQSLFEMRYADREAVLPPSLHPTNPPTLVVQAWSCEESPWGAFSLAQVRIGCRSGVRTRGLVVGAVSDNADAARALGEGWGFAVLPGTVQLERRYDGMRLHVERDAACVLSVATLDPDPLAPGDVQYTGTLTLAHTPRGLRLIQVEPVFDLERAERLDPQSIELDAAAWGQPLLSPYHAVSASLARGHVTLPAPRFVCRPDILAFTGTEAV